MKTLLASLISTFLILFLLSCASLSVEDGQGLKFAARGVGGIQALQNTQVQTAAGTVYTIGGYQADQRESFRDTTRMTNAIALAWFWQNVQLEKEATAQAASAGATRESIEAIRADADVTKVISNNETSLGIQSLAQ